MTQLCVIPGCLIRGRHLPACEDEDCKGCLPRLAEDGRSCRRCLSLAAQNLGTVGEVALAASDAANRLTGGSGGGGSGKPGSRLPLDLGARSRLDGVENRIYGWARHVAEERGVREPGLPVPPKPAIGPVCRTRYECVHSSCKDIRDPAYAPVLLAVVTGWLVGHLDWLAHRDEVDEAFSDFAACARALRGVVRGPAEQKFFGICGSTITWDADGNEIQRDEPCKGDVLGRPGAEEATCRLCKARWQTAPRAKELGDKVREHAFSAKWIHEAYPEINVKTLRSWANRGRLKTWWRTGEGLTTPWVEPVIDPALKGDELAVRKTEVEAELKARGPRLHYVGEVLDLGVAAKHEQETERAKRERRAAAKAEDARMSA